MILCAVDDLMFSTRITTAARGVGATVQFERDPDRLLARVRELQPSLVIFDLNNARLQPMTAIGAIGADPALRQVRTLGYVSHVDADTIAAARAAGIGQVLARSAFSERLGDILRNAGA